MGVIVHFPQPGENPVATAPEKATRRRKTAAAHKERWDERSDWEDVPLPPVTDEDRIRRVRTAFFDAVADGTLVRANDARFLMAWISAVVEGSI